MIPHILLETRVVVFSEVTSLDEEKVQGLKLLPCKWLIPVVSLEHCQEWSKELFPQIFVCFYFFALGSHSEVFSIITGSTLRIYSWHSWGIIWDAKDWTSVSQVEGLPAVLWLPPPPDFLIFWYIFALAQVTSFPRLSLYSLIHYFPWNTWVYSYLRENH